MRGSKNHEASSCLGRPSRFSPFPSLPLAVLPLLPLLFPVQYEVPHVEGAAFRELFRCSGLRKEDCVGRRSRRTWDEDARLQERVYLGTGDLFAPIDLQEQQRPYDDHEAFYSTNTTPRGDDDRMIPGRGPGSAVASQAQARPSERTTPMKTEKPPFSSTSQSNVARGPGPKEQSAATFSSTGTNRRDAALQTALFNVSQIAQLGGFASFAPGGILQSALVHPSLPAPVPGALFGFPRPRELDDEVVFYNNGRAPSRDKNFIPVYSRHDIEAEYEEFRTPPGSERERQARFPEPGDSADFKADEELPSASAQHYAGGNGAAAGAESLLLQTNRDRKNAEGKQHESKFSATSSDITSHLQCQSVEKRCDGSTSKIPKIDHDADLSAFEPPFSRSTSQEGQISRLSSSFELVYLDDPKGTNAVVNELPRLETDPNFLVDVNNFLNACAPPAKGSSLEQPRPPEPCRTEQMNCGRATTAGERPLTHSNQGGYADGTAFPKETETRAPPSPLEDVPQPKILRHVRKSRRDVEAPGRSPKSGQHWMADNPEQNLLRPHLAPRRTKGDPVEELEASCCSPGYGLSEEDYRCAAEARALRERLALRVATGAAPDFAEVLLPGPLERTVQRHRRDEHLIHIGPRDEPPACFSAASMHDPIGNAAAAVVYPSVQQHAAEIPGLSLSMQDFLLLLQAYNLDEARVALSPVMETTVSALLSEEDARKCFHYALVLKLVPKHDGLENMVSTPEEQQDDEREDLQKPGALSPDSGLDGSSPSGPRTALKRSDGSIDDVVQMQQNKQDPKGEGDLQEARDSTIAEPASLSPEDPDSERLVQSSPAMLRSANLQKKGAQRSTGPGGSSDEVVSSTGRSASPVLLTAVASSQGDRGMGGSGSASPMGLTLKKNPYSCNNVTEAINDYGVECDLLVHRLELERDFLEDREELEKASCRPRAGSNVTATIPEEEEHEDEAEQSQWSLRVQHPSGTDLCSSALRLLENNSADVEEKECEQSGQRWPPRPWSSSQHALHSEKSDQMHRRPATVDGSSEQLKLKRENTDEENSDWGLDATTCSGRSQRTTSACSSFGSSQSAETSSVNGGNDALKRTTSGHVGLEGEFSPPLPQRAPAESEENSFLREGVDAVIQTITHADSASDLRGNLKMKSASYPSSASFPSSSSRTPKSRGPDHYAFVRIERLSTGEISLKYHLHPLGNRGKKKLSKSSSEPTRATSTFDLPSDDVHEDESSAASSSTPSPEPQEIDREWQAYRARETQGLRALAQGSSVSSTEGAGHLHDNQRSSTEKILLVPEEHVARVWRAGPEHKQRGVPIDGLKWMEEEALLGGWYKEAQQHQASWPSRGGQHKKYGNLDSYDVGTNNCQHLVFRFFRDVIHLPQCGVYYSNTLETPLERSRSDNFDSRRPTKIDPLSTSEHPFAWGLLGVKGLSDLSDQSDARMACISNFEAFQEDLATGYYAKIDPPLFGPRTDHSHFFD
ncbi:unnamed protein product [Amoebophrya sp. A120]|nr:unnamed protein product [Amoebophrya sp. A120]|eukprot:GSA120T00011526001.1